MKYLLYFLAILALCFGAVKLYEGIEARGAAKQLLVDQKAMDKQKIEAAALLLAETQKADKATADFKAFVTTQEKKDVQAQIILSNQASTIRNLRNAAGQLFDPNGSRCGQSSGSPSTGDSQAPGDRGQDGGQTGGLLSVPISDLLEKIMREADTINAAYASCRPFALKASTP